MPRRWHIVQSVVLCHVHGCVHDRDPNPYDMIGPDGPINECGPEHWHNLAALAEPHEVEGY